MTLPWSIEKTITVVVTDLQGNTVLKEKILSKTQTLDLQRDMVSGIYLVIFFDGAQSVAIEKLVVR